MRRTPLLLAVVILLLGLVAGCVSVPTSGPVEKVEGQPPECQNCINVDVAPPSVGDASTELAGQAPINKPRAHSVARLANPVFDRVIIMMVAFARLRSAQQVLRQPCRRPRLPPLHPP